MFGIILGFSGVPFWVFFLFAIVFELFVGFLFEVLSGSFFKKIIVDIVKKNHIAQCLFSIEGPCTILA